MLIDRLSKQKTPGAKTTQPIFLCEVGQFFFVCFVFVTFKLRCYTIKVQKNVSTYSHPPLFVGRGRNLLLCLKVYTLDYPTAFANAHLTFLCRSAKVSVGGGGGYGTPFIQDPLDYIVSGSR